MAALAARQAKTDKVRLAPDEQVDPVAGDVTTRVIGDHAAVVDNRGGRVVSAEVEA